MTDKTFIKITNKMVYDKLLDIEEHILTTNGKVKLNKWIATTALSLILAFTIAYITTTL